MEYWLILVIVGGGAALAIGVFAVMRARRSRREAKPQSRAAP